MEARLKLILRCQASIISLSANIIFFPLWYILYPIPVSAANENIKSDMPSFLSLTIWVTRFKRKSMHLSSILIKLQRVCKNCIRWDHIIIIRNWPQFSLALSYTEECGSDTEHVKPLNWATLYTFWLVATGHIPRHFVTLKPQPSQEWYHNGLQLVEKWRLSWRG